MVSPVFVVGNWKMNGSAQLAKEFSEKLDRIQPELAKEVNVALCVPDTLLASFGRADTLRIGAQNISEFESGAYTGEISAILLKEQECDLVIVGHSERRQLFLESSQSVAKKAAKALEHGLTPIVCLGETEQDREHGRTFDVIGEQLSAVRAELNESLMTQIWLAYEPVWAIGTGKTASPEQAQEVHSWLRDQLGPTGVELPILYGGSVKAGNAGELFQQKDIDGGLIGGASLDINEFEGICRKADALMKQEGL